MDEITLKQLKESNYYHPVITDVIHDYKIVLEMVADGLNSTELGYNTVWDAEMCKWASKYFVEGLELVKQRIKGKGIKCRLITEVNTENEGFLNTLPFVEIRHLDGLRGNFGIRDEKGYMAFVLHKEDDESLQTYFSNSKLLAEKQMQLFEELWSMAIPFSTRIKELEYEVKRDTQKTMSGFENIQGEVESLLITCKKDLTTFSSNKILCYLLNKGKFIDYLPKILQKEASIKILMEDVDEYLTRQIASINASTQVNPIQIGYTNKIAEINEMVIIFDSKHVLHVNYDPNNKLVATYSNEEHKVLIRVNVRKILE
ncbi:hypothetical protein [Candidatus Nitrosocosmicus sp. R]